MTKEEATMVAFEIVAYSGDARSKLLMAVEKAKAGDLVTADRLVAEANECLVDAHKAQTDLLQQEARGDPDDGTGGTGARSPRRRRPGE